MTHKISRKIYPTLLALLSITSSCFGSQEEAEIDKFFLAVYHCYPLQVLGMVADNPELANIRPTKAITYPQSLWADLRGKRPDAFFVRPLHALAITHHNWLREQIIRTMGLRITIANLLITKGADVNSTVADGRTPLSSAAAFGNYALAQFLIQHGAHVDGVNGYSPLSRAAASGNMNIVQLLIENGANVNATSPTGATPLHSAARSEDIDIVLLLIEQGANVNATSIDGWTPLHEAAMNGDITVVQLLVQHGADTNAVTEYGTTPFFYAINRGYLAIATYLLQSGAEIDYEYINPPMFNGHKQAIIFLLKRCFYVTDKHARSIETAGVNNWRQVQADAGKDLFDMLNSNEVYDKIQLPKDLSVLILSLMLSPDAYTLLHSSLRQAGEFSATESGTHVSLSEETDSWLSQLPTQLTNGITAVLCMCARRR